MSNIYIQYIILLKHLIADINYPLEIIMLIVEIIYVYTRPMIKCGYENTFFTIGEKNYVCGMIHPLEGPSLELNYLYPRKFMIDEQIKSISFGYNNLFAVTQFSNQIYCVGTNYFGQLGLGHCNPQSSLILFDFDKKIESVYTNGDSTFAITNKKKCYAWGYGRHGKLGSGLSENVFVPKKIPLEGILSVKCGEYHTIFLTRIECFVCGLNDYGQLGLGDYDDRHLLQKLLLENIIYVGCGTCFSLALTTNGIYTWGKNDSGQLGHTKQHNLPQKVLIINPVSANCGAQHTIVLTKNGTLYGWGANTYGQLGIGQTQIQTPQKINLSEFIIELDCGAYYTIVRTTKNEIYGWGRNSNGQLGLGDTEERHAPTKITFRSTKL